MDLTIEVGGKRVSYVREGAGPPLVLVHGWPLHARTWRASLPRLAERFTCYAPDLPGLGDTEWDQATDFSTAAMARWLIELADALRLERFAFLAFDTGATAARLAAAELGERVTGLVFSNTEIPGHRPPWIRAFQRLGALPGAKGVFRVCLSSRGFRRSGMGYGGCFVDRALIEGEFLPLFVQPLLDSTRRMEGALRYLRGIDWNLVDDLDRVHARIRAPVGVIWGADDRTFPIERARPMLGSLARLRGLVEIRGGALLVHEEKPADYCRAALELLQV